MIDLSQVNLNLKGRASVEYVKARYAIEANAQEISRGNAARAVNYASNAKDCVIEAFKGKVESNQKGKFVKFQDGSKAAY